MFTRKMKNVALVPSSSQTTKEPHPMPRFANQSGEKKRTARHALSPAVSGYWILLACMSLLAPATVLAGTFSCTTATGSGADTQIFNGDPGSADTNYGDYAYPGVVTYADPGWSMKSYVRFDTTGLTGTATNASLTVCFTALVSPPTAINVFGLKNSSAGQDWGESTITYNNAPANNLLSAGGAYTTPGTGGVTTDAEFLGTFNLTGDDAQSFSNNALLTFLNADTDHLVTFIFTPAVAAKNVQFFAKEIGVPSQYPTLSVDTAIPEPTSAIVLLVSGSLALTTRKRPGRK